MILVDNNNAEKTGWSALAISLAFQPGKFNPAKIRANHRAPTGLITMVELGGDGKKGSFHFSSSLSLAVLGGSRASE